MSYLAGWFKSWRFWVTLGVTAAGYLIHPLAFLPLLWALYLSYALYAATH